MATLDSRTQMIQALRRLFIFLPHVKEATQRLESLMSYECSAGEEAENLMLLGPSGVGKSTLLEHFRRKHPRIENDTYTEIPVLYVSINAKCTITTLAGSMLREMQSEFWNKGKEDERTVQLITLLKGCKVRIVILDEANHLIDRGGEKTHHNLADWIKSLTSEVKIPFVLAGIPRAKKLSQTNDQLGSRFREVLEIHPFSVADESDMLQFRGVIKAFSDTLKDLPSIELHSEKIAKKIAYATDGRLRDIRTLLLGAIDIAYRQPTPELSLDILSEAFIRRIYPAAPDNRNPFHEKFQEVPLNRVGEPYAPVERK